jgi:thioredoxin 1
MMSVVTLDSRNFESEVLQSANLVLVDFYADWCGPCKMVAPLVEELSKEYEGQVTFGKLNIDNAQDLAVKYGVTSIPSLILFKGGEKVDQVLGAIPKAQIEDFVKKSL